MNKADAVKNYMKHLGVTKAEAEQLWADDHADVVGAEGEELQKKANALEKTYTPTEKNKRTRKVKFDAEKAKIVEMLNQTLTDAGFTSKVVNSQRQIDFGAYTLTLIKHRPPKR